MNKVVREVTARVIERSRTSREDYLKRMRAAASSGPYRKALSCANLAHAAAASPVDDKETLKYPIKPNIAIVNSFNDMLSAHQPYESYPEIIKNAARKHGAVAQVAGGVPAMCDGVTQGQPGMELSLFSRDVIALSTAVALSHNMFDGCLCLGVCDKIVPGLLIGALSFGHLPVAFVPAGPMVSGLDHLEKAKTRKLHAQGKVGEDALIDSEFKCFHAAGTCTFYGTANTNQMLMEVMGLHLPGSSFVNPGDKLRESLTALVTERIVKLTQVGGTYIPMCDIVSEHAVINGIIGLLASGGSTNLTIHLVAIARAAGVIIDWDDFSALSSIVPLITKIYPNGKCDMNDFHRAGGVPFVIRELLDAGLLNNDVKTIMGEGLESYTKFPVLDGEDKVTWRDLPKESPNRDVVRVYTEPYAPDGGVKLLSGNLGRAICKTSALPADKRVVRAPAIVFTDQKQIMKAFQKGELNKDFVAVVKFQGPRARGMPELHKLTPLLGALQDQGHSVGLVTDGRMSGASGNVLMAIHVTPECSALGPLTKVRDGDIVSIDSINGTFGVEISDQELHSREPERWSDDSVEYGMGRELFAGFRAMTSSAEEGAVSLRPGCSL